MSTFLFGKQGLLIPAGQSREATKTQFRGYLAEAGWQILAETATTLDLIPPANEPVGNAQGHEALRIIFNVSDIRLQTLIRPAAAAQKKLAVRASSSGSSGSLTVGGQLVSVSGATGGFDVLLGSLHSALVSSGSAEVQKYRYDLVKGPGTSDDHILMTEVAPLIGGAVSGAGVSVYPVSDGYAAHTLIHRAARLQGDSFVLGVDYAQGWVLYLAVLSRAVVIASKTLAGVNHPIAAQFLDQDSALAQTPPNCFPVQLALARVNTALSSTSRHGQVSFGSQYGYASASAGTYDASQYENAYLVDALSNRVDFTYAAPSPRNFVARSASTEPVPTPLPAALAPSASIGGIFGPSGITLAPLSVATAYASFGNPYSSLWTPAAILEDVVGFLAVAGDESLHLTRSDVFSPLDAALDAGGLSLTLASTAGFPPSGTVVVDGEVIGYSSQTPGTLDGLTRGLYGTQSAAHAAGAAVHLGFWWTKLGLGAVQAGYVKPS